MEVVHRPCCGIDVRKASLCACISIREGDISEKQKRRFDTTMGQLKTLAQWLKQYGGVLEASVERAGGRIRTTAGQSAASEIDSW